MKHFAEITTAAGTRRVRLDAPQLKLGSSSDADITLDDPAIGAELAVITPHAEACTVTRIQGARGELRMDGQPFERGDVPWGSVLQVGGAQLRLLAETKQEGTSPVLLIAAVASLAFMGWSFTQESDRSSLLGQMPDAPALFGEEDPCPASGSSAAHRAQQLEDAALAKADRAPFDPRDGMHAAASFASAARCYESAGKAQEAKRTAKQRDAWRAQMRTRYKSSRLRLRLALEARQSRDALREVSGLLALLDGRSDPYVGWLERLERRLRMALEAAR